MGTSKSQSLIMHISFSFFYICFIDYLLKCWKLYLLANGKFSFGLLEDFLLELISLDFKSDLPFLTVSAIKVRYFILMLSKLMEHITLKRTILHHKYD